MSTVKISELTALSSADAADELVIVDDSAGVTKKITHANLANFGSGTVTAGALALGTGTVTAGAIDFSGLANAAGMTSEVLDDYEEGTWTPKLKATGLTGDTYSTQKGFYTKIGNIVFAACDLKTTNNGSGSGSLFVTGLPFTTSTTSGTNWNFGVAISQISASAGEITIQVQVNTNDLVLVDNTGSSSTLAAMDFGDFTGTTTEIRFGIYYFI